MAIRTVKKELEAKLFPVGQSSFFSRPRGIIERKIYGKGSERLKILISNFKVPDGDEVEIVIGDNLLSTLKIKKGSAKLDLKSEDGNTIPQISAGESAEIRHNNNVIVKGKFTID